MRTNPVFLCLLLAGLTSLACSSSDNGPSGVDGTTSPTTPTTPTTSAPATWTAIYDTYIGPGTPGHCGDARCHAADRRGFKCGRTKDECYAGLVAKGLLDPDDPAASLLVDARSSPLAWFNPNGLMPGDAAKPNAQAAADSRAWVAAGAKHD